jgi:hypothetical protein
VDQRRGVFCTRRTRFSEEKWCVEQIISYELIAIDYKLWSIVWSIIMDNCELWTIQTSWITV